MERVLNQVLIALIALAGMLWLFQSSDTCKSMFGKAKSAIDTPGPNRSGSEERSGSPGTSLADPEPAASEFESGWDSGTTGKSLAQAPQNAPISEEFTPKGSAAAIEEGALSYLIVTGSFASQEQAAEAVLQLRKQGYKHAWLTKTIEGRYRVQAGAYTKAMARQVLQEIRKDIPDAYLKQAE